MKFSDFYMNMKESLIEIKNNIAYLTDIVALWKKNYVFHP